MDWRSHGNIARYHHHHHVFLFEATGDSEGDSYFVEYSEANLESFIWMNILGGLPFISNEDDAESCSSDSIDDHRDLEDQDSLDSDDTHVEEVMVVVEEEEEEKVAEESRNIAGVHGSRKMMVDELEGDRLFWETCLEAGYP